MKTILAFLLTFCMAFGYEIRHENHGKFYHFVGSADGEKFELYLNTLEMEFENFKNTQELKMPAKIHGHIFFKNEKFEFDKGELKREVNATSINALSEWVNLEIKSAQNGEFVGKLAVRGKAMRASAKKKNEYEILALGLQILEADGTQFEAVVSDYFSFKFTKKYQKSLLNTLENLKYAWLKTSYKIAANNYINELEYQNEKIKSVCASVSKTQKFCSATLLKGLKKLGIDDVFKDVNDPNLAEILAKNQAVLSSNFTLSPAGVTFYSDGAKSIKIDEIKQFLKQNFGLFE